MPVGSHVAPQQGPEPLVVLPRAGHDPGPLTAGAPAPVRHVRPALRARRRRRTATGGLVDRRRTTACATGDRRLALPPHPVAHVTARRPLPLRLSQTAMLAHRPTMRYPSGEGLGTSPPGRSAAHLADPGPDLRSRRLDRHQACVRADSTGSRPAFAPTRPGPDLRSRRLDRVGRPGPTGPIRRPSTGGSLLSWTSPGWWTGTGAGS